MRLTVFLWQSKEKLKSCPKEILTLYLTQVYTYVTGNAYVCLTVYLTGNEELLEQNVLEKLQFTIVRYLQIQNYCNKIVLEGSVCLNPSKSSSVSVRYLQSFFT